jgi:hypothetical protein
VVRSLLGSLGGNSGREFLYLVRNDILYTHLGCFGAPGGTGASAKSFDNAYQKSGLPNWESGASWASSSSVLLLGSLGSVPYT